MPRPLSLAEREKVEFLLERGNTPAEISKQIPFVGISEIKRYVEALRSTEPPPVRMSVSLAYFEFPQDPPWRLARRLGYREEEVKMILKSRGLPWREK